MQKSKGFVNQIQFKLSLLLQSDKVVMKFIISRMWRVHKVTRQIS